MELIAAPSNLGLRPPSPGHEPGAWRAPEAMLAAGLGTRLASERLVELDRPPYDFEAQSGTRIRNGLTIREHGLMLADAVESAVSAGRSALVLGGDCSIPLGCLLGAVRGGRCGLVHVDGHIDFFHPGNYDTASRLGSVAGMDLALATGRGEPLLTEWPKVGAPLVADADAIQVGDRETEPAEGSGTGTLEPSIAQLTVQEILRRGVAEVCDRVVEHLQRRGLDWVWLHVDLDVLDQGVLPAVDSPGSPGLDFAQLADLLARLVGTGRVIGLDVTIYDPELDPKGNTCRRSSIASRVDWPKVRLRCPRPDPSSRGRRTTRSRGPTMRVGPMDSVDRVIQGSVSTDRWVKGTGGPRRSRGGR